MDSPLKRQLQWSRREMVVLARMMVEGDGFEKLMGFDGGHIREGGREKDVVRMNGCYSLRKGPGDKNLLGEGHL